MSELVRLTPEQPTAVVDQGEPVEARLMLVEQKKTLEKGDIDAFLAKAGELSGIHEVQQGLESSIIGAGLQVIADKYGADRLIVALQTHGVISFQDVIKQLAPEKADRKALYEAIKTEPMDSLAERFNETLGGVAQTTNPGLSQMERYRYFDVVQIQGKMTNGGNIIPRSTNIEGMTDGATPLLSGDFNSLLEKHPDLVEEFRESNDTFTLLKGVREIYQTEYAQFSSDLEQAKATVEEKVADGEAAIAELQTLAENIYGDEIAKLEERLAGASSDAAKEMIQGILDKRAAEVTAASEEFKNKMEAIRNKIVADLNADRLYQLYVAPPTKTQPTYNDKEWRTS